MKFFQDHFTKHHLFHAPHKWFLALLISPIHAAEMHYKKKYHLNFAHAKKLFAFDLILLLSVAGLASATVFWFAYQPTVADLVGVTITQSRERIQSGDDIIYTARYQNNSGVTLRSVQLALDFPENFLLGEAQPQAQYQAHISTFSLADLPPGAHGNVTVEGRFFHTPHQETRLIAHLSYQPETRDWREEKIGRIISVARGSILKSRLLGPAKILAQGQTPVTIELENTSDIALSLLTVPLQLATGIMIVEPTTTIGTASDEVWQIESLPAGRKSILQGQLRSNISLAVSQTALTITPNISINGRTVPQASDITTVEVLAPKAIMTVDWKGGQQKVQPGQTSEMALIIKNQGEVNLADLTLNLTLPPAMVDIKKLTELNLGTYKNDTLRISKSQRANLANLKPGQKTDLLLTIPIVIAPTGGTDLLLTLSPRLVASVEGVPDSQYTTSAASPPLAIGTRLRLASSLRYYTDEGDQLGRGPLPPQVDKETKYWVIVEIKNTTSQVSDLMLSATLPAYVRWTGKTSVSHGQEARYNPANRSVVWQTGQLNAHESAGVYFELGWTPTEADRGRTPVVVKDIKARAHDDYIDAAIMQTSADLDISLPADEKARQRGIEVR